jgi:hypothetical protein
VRWTLVGVDFRLASGGVNAPRCHLRIPCHVFDDEGFRRAYSPQYDKENFIHQNARAEEDRTQRHLVSSKEGFRLAFSHRVTALHHRFAIR